MQNRSKRTQKKGERMGEQNKSEGTELGGDRKREKESKLKKGRSEQGASGQRGYTFRKQGLSKVGGKKRSRQGKNKV